MANDQTLLPLGPQPGIQRDGTNLDGNVYTDALWCRFRRGRPKKMGGFREICHVSANGGDMLGPIRTIFPYNAGGGLYYTYCFHGSGITAVSVDQNGVGTQTGDRTPAAFVAQDTYCWQVDSLWDVNGGGMTTILAHPGNNLSDIASNVVTDVYYGDASDGITPLTAIGQQVSGGVVVLQPFVFLYGSDGLIMNSDANKPTTFAGGFANTANVAGTKIVKGLPLRGGGNSPAGLFWSIDGLIRVTFTPGGTTDWRYDTLSEETSILSSSSVIEYDGLYFWASLDRFMVYNGTIQEVPNGLNQDFFYDNINMAYRQKVWVTKLPRWGEIWWFFPKGGATECNWAVVYNVREKTWYDTPVFRSAGYPARELVFPMWASNEAESDSGVNVYGLYRHEFGVDAIDNGVQVAIRSYFDTPYIGFASGGVSGQMAETPNKQTRIIKVEPDFTQSGDMFMTVLGQPFAQSQPQAETDPIYFSPVAPFPNSTTGVTPIEATIDVGKQRRLLKLHFESNVIGGDYLMGRPLLHLEEGDGHA